MNTKELLEKIARYKSAMEAETDVDTKKKFQSRIDQLEKDIAQVEAAVEKKEEKIEKQEDKALEEAEKKLRRYKDAMDAETDPDTKAKFQKRIDDLEKQLKGVKEQIKEEKKEIEEQKKDIKDAVQDVQSAQKAVRTQAIKKAGKQVAARKTTATQKKTRKKTIANIISKLDKLIDKNPALKAKYKGARGGSYMQYPSVDLKRDAGRASKPFGYRFKGDNTKVPRPDQRGQSNVYYENRANRADVYPKRKIKLEDGGDMMADGGEAVDLMTNTFINLFKSRGFKEKRGSMGLMFFEHKPTGVFITFDPKGYQTPVIITTDKSGENTIYEGNSIREVMESLDRLGITDKMADGGKTTIVDKVSSMSFRNNYDDYEMVVISKELNKDGGKLIKDRFLVSAKDIDEAKKIATDLWKEHFGETDLSIVKVMSAEAYKHNYLGQMAEGGETKYRGTTKGKHYVGRFTEAQLKNKEDKKAIEKAQKETGLKYVDTKMVKKAGKIVAMDVYLIDEETYLKQPLMADGGMAGHGKRMSTGGVVLNIYESGADWKINKPTQREFDDYKSAKRMGEKSGAFEYEILDEITGDVMYSTHSEKMTPSLAYKDGGRQGYDDREDESLAMRRGKTASKDLKGKKKKKEKSRRDDAGFEKRAKVVYTWKPEAKQVIESMAKQPKKRGISKSILNKKPSEYYAKKFPELVNVEKQ